MLTSTILSETISRSVPKDDELLLLLAIAPSTASKYPDTQSIVTAIICISKYKNIEVAVAAYNAGIGTVDNWIEKEIIKSDGSDIENIPYKETNNYVRKILRNYKIYQDLYK